MARQSSAKASTAVRIRSGPRRVIISWWLFFYVMMLDPEFATADSTAVRPDSYRISVKLSEPHRGDILVVSK